MCKTEDVIRPFQAQRPAFFSKKVTFLHFKKATQKDVIILLLYVRAVWMRYVFVAFLPAHLFLVMLWRIRRGGRVVQKAILACQRAANAHTFLCMFLFHDWQCQKRREVGSKVDRIVYYTSSTSRGGSNVGGRWLLTNRVMSSHAFALPASLGRLNLDLLCTYYIVLTGARNCAPVLVNLRQQMLFVQNGWQKTIVFSIETLPQAFSTSDLELCRLS